MTNNYKVKLRKEARERYWNLSEEKIDKKRKHARERYRSLSGEEQDKKRQYGRERYKNLLEDKYRENLSRMQEMKTIWV